MLVESGADAIEHCRHMLAHICPVRATARKLDLLGRREQARVLPANPFHDALGKPSLEKLDERINRARAVRADGFPASLGDRSNFHRDFVNLRAADQSVDRARSDLKIDYRTVSHIGPPARQPVGKVAVALEIVAPGLAPEGLDDGASFDDHRRDGLPLLLALLHLAGRFPPPFCHGNVGFPSPVIRHRSRLL